MKSTKPTIHKTSNRKVTIRTFIEACWGILQQAKREEGATLNDLYAISQEVGAPRASRAAFQFAYYQVAKNRS
jgi:hypothetical protein